MSAERPGFGPKARIRPRVERRALVGYRWVRLLAMNDHESEGQRVVDSSRVLPATDRRVIGRLLQMSDDERWMDLAHEEAIRAAAAGEVPVGAVVVLDG